MEVRSLCLCQRLSSFKGKPWVPPLRIILLGATGRLGRYLACILSKKYKVYAPRPRFHQAPLIEGLKWLSSDIDARRQAGIERLMKEADPNVVINCIAITPDSLRDTDVQSVILTNSVFPHYISGVTKQWGAKLIHISTDGVFSGQKGGYSEVSPPDPCDLYGRSKLLGEVIDENCLTIRTSFYGPCARGRGLVDWIISKRGEEISGYQNYVFSGLSMTTLARAIVTVLDKEGGLGGLYHLGGPKLSKFELLEMLSEKLGLNVKVHAVSEPVIDLSLDSTRFYDDTNMVFPTLGNMMQEIKEEAKALGML